MADQEASCTFKRHDNSLHGACIDLREAVCAESNGQTGDIGIERIQEKSQHDTTGATETDEESVKVTGVSTDEKAADCIKVENICEVCCNVSAKYRCPRCETRSCSLPCVKQHKITSGCSGERDKTAFVDISCYSDKDLLNDYRFLEDAERRLFSNHSAPVNRGRQSVRFTPYHINKRCKFLMNAAYKRGINLSFVHPGLSRNRINTSFYTISDDKIEWHVDWLFSSTATLVKDEKVAETQILIDQVRKFTNFTEYPHLRKSLEEYRGDRLDSCQFLLKVEGLPANRTRYFALKPKETLAENLKGLCLIEYPTVVVVPSSDQQAQDNYPRLCKEDMVEMDRGSAQHMVKFHPELIPLNYAEQEILNINSSLYVGAQGEGK
ncbi:hypothetical protein EGW08_018402 [Elysia chlorotica]|uniref:HIT-type domain-containing protein n=1 Tax=Elysia chlorotica TaxID=188477 RepID=A0A433SX04_ELYCH|nr:hypothetical protein EGW08_018402 [Elysia chlorotica]